jgi:hypothetical protein
VTGAGDLFPQATIKWNRGVYNYMVYLTGDIPVGDYDSSRLSNIGFGHAAFDGGGDGPGTLCGRGLHLQFHQSEHELSKRR